jgi:hypothetical protein
MAVVEGIEREDAKCKYVKTVLVLNFQRQHIPARFDYRESELGFIIQTV